MNSVVGDTVDVIATFRNASEELTNPTSVLGSVKYPSGATASPAAVNLSTGRYAVPVSVDEEGIIYVRVVGSGNSVDSAAESTVCGIASSL